MSSRFLLALYVYVVYVSFSFQVIVCDATERSISAENYPFILFGATVFSTCSLKHRDRVHHHEYTERSDMYRVYIHQNRSHLPFIYRILPCNFVYFVRLVHPSALECMECTSCSSVIRCWSVRACLIVLFVCWTLLAICSLLVKPSQTIANIIKL
eukprot:492563_1